MNLESIFIVFVGVVLVNLIVVSFIMFVQTKWINAVIQKRIFKVHSVYSEDWKALKADLAQFLKEVTEGRVELQKIKESVEIQRAELFNDLSNTQFDEDFIVRLNHVSGLLVDLHEQKDRFYEISTSLFNLQSIIRNYALQIEQGEAENLQLALKAYQSRINGDKRQEQLSRYLNGAIKALSPKAAEEISSRIGKVHLIQKSDVKHDAVP